MSSHTEIVVSVGFLSFQKAPAETSQEATAQNLLPSDVESISHQTFPCLSSSHPDEHEHSVIDETLFSTLEEEDFVHIFDEDTKLDNQSEEDRFF